MLQQKINNIKFFGISDNVQEIPEDTEAVLRKFLHKEMKISKTHLDEIDSREFKESQPEYSRKKQINAQDR